MVDYGLSLDLYTEDYLVKSCGTPGYIAPETFVVTEDDKVSTKVDIFSTGVIIYQIILGRLPFKGKKNESVITKNRNCQLDFDDKKLNSFPKLKKLLK